MCHRESEVAAAQGWSGLVLWCNESMARTSGLTFVLLKLCPELAETSRKLDTMWPGSDVWDHVSLRGTSWCHPESPGQALVGRELGLEAPGKNPELGGDGRSLKGFWELGTLKGRERGCRGRGCTSMKGPDYSRNWNQMCGR